MDIPPTIYYQMEYDEKTKVYTGYCPTMKPVRFSGKDKAKVKELVVDGIEVFLDKNPHHFDGVLEYERPWR